MTVELIAAICAGIVTVLTAITTLIITLRTAAKVEETKKEVQIDAALKDQQLKGITVLVDGTLSKALSEISALRTTIAKQTGNEGDKALAIKAEIDARPKPVPLPVIGPNPLEGVDPVVGTVIFTPHEPKT